MPQATDVPVEQPALRGAGLARTGAVVLVGAVAVLYVANLRRTGGTFVYPLDDPAIHLAVARRLAYDGTWGVVAGHYQAASSSPLWTLILAPTQWVVRGAAGERVPLVLNLLAALWVLALLRPDLAALADGDRPAGRGARAVGLAAVAALVTVVLFLPGLVMIGMEHTLHMALVLATALAVEARWVRPDGRVGRWARWGPFVLMGVATTARGESAFVAVALAMGLVAVDVGGWHDPERPPASRGTRVRAALGLGLASAAALGVFGAVNLAYGQDFLPNSVILKSIGDRGDPRRSPAAAFERFTSDHLLVALVVVAIVVLVLARRWRASVPRDLVPAVFPALVTVVAVALQAELGGLDRLLRYQAYLYGLGVLTVLRALPAARRRLAGRWPAVPAAVLVLLLVPVAVTQIRVTAREPDDSETTWEQRYQVARFLGEAYPHDPIAIGELGYISLYHHGPLTDIYGLGDHEVLVATLDGRKNAGFWADMAHRRGFRVVATYDFTMSADTPRDWFPVADWRSPRAFYKTTRFWATDPGEVEPLIRAIEAYEPHLPSDVRVTINPLARVAAARRGAGA